MSTMCGGFADKVHRDPLAKSGSGVRAAASTNCPRTSVLHVSLHDGKSAETKGLFWGKSQTAPPPPLAGGSNAPAAAIAATKVKPEAKRESRVVSKRQANTAAIVATTRAARAATTSRR